jgi:hypothetical protein
VTIYSKEWSEILCPELWKFRRNFQYEVMNEVHYRSSMASSRT